MLFVLTNNQDFGSLVQMKLFSRFAPCLALEALVLVIKRFDAREFRETVRQLARGGRAARLYSMSQLERLYNYKIHEVNTLGMGTERSRNCSNVTDWYPQLKQVTVDCN